MNGSGHDAGLDQRKEGAEAPASSGTGTGVRHGLLYNIISRRHEQRSTVVSTNLAYKQWSTVFPGAACVVALVDRFAQHCHVIDIDAESWRNKEATTHTEHKKDPKKH